jgi:glucose-1-phosphate cytidylyltransferase
MKAVILAGGLGTRISEETVNRPKPMIGIGGRPILWHIMKIYSSHGIHDFVICCGYMGYVIKEYFANYFLHMSDVTFDMTHNRMEIHERHAEPWRVTLVDTGDTPRPAGGWGVCASTWKTKRPSASPTATGWPTSTSAPKWPSIAATASWPRSRPCSPPGRFGALELKGDDVDAFVEKPLGDGGFINGGYFVLSPKVLDLHRKGDQTVFEGSVLGS